MRFLEELDRAFKKGDVDAVVALGVRLLHMGWYSKLDWFLERFNEMLRYLPPEERRRVQENELILNLMHLVMHLVRDMEPERALPYVRPKGSMIERRIYYEYLGNHPRAYHYLLRYERETKIKSFWLEIRKIYMRMYRGGRVSLREIERLETSEDEVEFVAQIITRGYAVGIYHILKGEIDGDTFGEIKRAVMYGLSENYDHTTSRLLQVFIPLSLMRGEERVARTYLNAAISTAQTEQNRYMYEWFGMYDLALRGDVEPLRERARLYEEKGYIGHEVLARAVSGLIGGGREELERAKALSDKYWHRHVLRYAEVLTGRNL
ncbi:MAG: hypothetical protein GXO29_00900 [Thermotogae bacterium]|nr:hypothetical protein [Thermotogota bacterium]